MLFYFNDYQNIKIINITNNYKFFNDKLTNNFTNINSYNFRYIYNISFDAIIDKKTLFKSKFFSNGLNKTINKFKYLINSDYNKIDS